MENNIPNSIAVRTYSDAEGGLHTLALFVTSIAGTGEKLNLYDSAGNLCGLVPLQHGGPKRIEVN